MQSKDRMLEVAERWGVRSVRYLRKIMVYTTSKAGTQKEAARILGVPYSTFRRWVKNLKLKL